MKSIDHLPESEKTHFMQCPTCKDYFNMRDLGQVFEHEHAGLKKPKWSSSRRIDDPTEFQNPEKGIDKIDLN